MVYERLRALREKAEISCGQLSILAGLSPRHCDLIERRKSDKIEVPTLIALAHVLGCTVGYLANGEGREPSAAVLKRSIAAAREKNSAA